MNRGVSTAGKVATVAAVGVGVALIAWSLGAENTDLPPGSSQPSDLRPEADHPSMREAAPTATSPEQTESAPTDTPPAPAPPKPTARPSTTSSTPEAATAAAPQTISGRLDWHASMRRDDFPVTYRRAGSDDELPVHVDPRGQFRVRGRPGTIDLLVRLRGDDIPLHVIPGITLPAAGVAKDARLALVDVSEARRITLTLVDAAGTPVTGWLHALVLAPDGATGRHVRANRRDGQLEITLRAPGQKVEVWADGFDRQKFEAYEDQVITLRGSATVRVTLHVPGGEYVVAQLTPDGEPTPAPNHWGELEMSEVSRMNAQDVPNVSRGEVERDREAGTVTQAFTVRRPGHYWAWWSSFGSAAPEDLGPNERKLVHVPRPVGEIHVELTVSAQGLRDARERMTERIEAERKAEEEARKAEEEAARAEKGG